MDILIELAVFCGFLGTLICALLIFVGLDEGHLSVIPIKVLVGISFLVELAHVSAEISIATTIIVIAILEIFIILFINFSKYCFTKFEWTLFLWRNLFIMMFITASIKFALD